MLKKGKGGFVDYDLINLDVYVDTLDDAILSAIREQAMDMNYQFEK
jgi:hypothetical protein